MKSSGQLFCRFSLAFSLLAHSLCTEHSGPSWCRGFWNHCFIPGFGPSYFQPDPHLIPEQQNPRSSPSFKLGTLHHWRYSKAHVPRFETFWIISGVDLTQGFSPALQGDTLFEVGWDSFLRMEGLESLPPDRCYLCFFILPMRKPRSILVKSFAQGLGTGCWKNHTQKPGLIIWGLELFLPSRVYKSSCE